MSSVLRPVILELDGIFGRLQDGAIINAGGVENTTGSFTVNGQGLLFENGASTSGGVGITLQKVYNNSSPAAITLTPGKDFIIYDDNNASLFFKIDAETGKVTITGDLEVLGSSSLIETTITDSDHFLLSPSSGFTSALKIEPDIGVTPIVDVMTVRTTFGGTPAFRIDKDGNIIITGLINGIDLSQFYSSFIDHTTFSASPKHASSEISVNGPFTNIGAPATVEEALQMIDALLVGGGGGGGSSAGLFFFDAIPASTGNIGNKQYIPNTVPSDRVITIAVTDTEDVIVELFAEADATFYSPTVTVTTVPPQISGPILVSLTEDVHDKRAFSGSATLTNITVNTLVTAVSSTGATASMNIIRAPAGPEFSSLTIGPYPGTQTAVKAGDILTVNGTVDNAALYAELLPGGANSALVVLVLGAADSGGVGLKTVTGSFTVSGLSGPQTVSARASNTFSTFGVTATSSNTTILDQIYPTIGTRTITYPPGQQALKGSEDALVAATITNFTDVHYSAVNMTVASPLVYGTKTVTRISGSYSYGANNYTISASRSINGASTMAQSAISIANVAPAASISIVGNPARLQSSPAGTDYTVTITANQQLLTAPALSASSGTWQGTWSGSGTTWTRVLRITDLDPKGPQMFSALSVTGLAGLVGSTINAGENYTVGGFATRTITFPAFARWAPIGTSIVDFTKTSASYTGGSTLTRYTDAGDYFQGFTIVDAFGNYNPNGDHLFISDSAFAGSNTSGTLQLDITEAV